MSQSKIGREVSQLQLIANRLNALKSTGPTSPEGKAKSRLNGTRHGHTGQTLIETDEEAAAHHKFQDAYVAELAPEGFIETDLAYKIADTAWRINRIRAQEDNYLSSCVATDRTWRCLDLPQVHTAIVQSTVFIRNSRDFVNFSLYEQRLDRLYHKNMKALEEMKKNRPLRKAIEQPEAAPPVEAPKVMASGAGSQHAEASQAESAQKETRDASTTSNENGFAFSNTPAASKPEPETPEPDIKNAA